MTDGGRDGATTPTRRLTLVSAALWMLAALVLPLTALTLNALKIGGFPLGFWWGAQGALLALALIALNFARRAGGAAPAEGVRPALAFAGEALGAATVVGFTGAIATFGYDGLSLTLGLVAGLALLTILIAPRFVLYPTHAMGGFFTVRFAGPWPRRVAFAILLCASVLLLAADLRAGALAVQGLLGWDLPSAVAALALAISAVWLGRSFIAGPVEGIVFVVIALGVLGTLLGLTLIHGGWPLPHLMLGYATDDLGALGQKLIVNKLADVKSLKPIVSPFLQASMTNFAGVVLAVALGIAAAPHIAGRHVAQTAAAPGAAPRRAALATLFVALFALSLAPLAVYSRLGVETNFAAAIETAAIPETLARVSGTGLIDVCGQRSDNVSELQAACAKIPGQRGFLRLQDVAYAPDSYVVAAPLLSGLGLEGSAPLWLAALLAALVTGHALLRGVLDADGAARVEGVLGPAPLDLRTVALAAAVLFAAIVIVLPNTLDSATLAADGFALLAAGLFPALLLGLFWRRMTSSGALAAMLTGFGLAAAYIFAVRFAPAVIVSWTGGLSDAAPAALRKFSDLNAALEAAGSADMADAARAALNRHAAGIANWFGLRPPAIVLIAVPLSFLAGASASLLASRREPAGGAAA